MIKIPQNTQFYTFLFLVAILVLISLYSSNKKNERLNSANDALVHYENLYSEVFELSKVVMEVQNVYVGDIVTYKGGEALLMSQAIGSSEATILYFGESLCSECMQDDIDSIISFYSTNFNDTFYLLVPMKMVREIKMLLSEKNINSVKFLYYTDSIIEIPVSMKPILLNVNSECVVESSFVIQKLNTELNTLYMQIAKK